MDYNHNNISPLDNRYKNKILDLREVFSEHALVKTRFIIEIDWLIFLCSNHSKYFGSISKSSSLPSSVTAILVSMLFVVSISIFFDIMPKLRKNFYILKSFLNICIIFA